MPKCPEAERCDFFNERLSQMPSTAALFRERYCAGDSRTCARHMALEVLGSGNVPTDLFPDEVGRAQRDFGA